MMREDDKAIILGEHDSLRTESGTRSWAAREKIWSVQSGKACAMRCSVYTSPSLA